MPDKGVMDMSAAISIRKAKGVILDNVFIHGFRQGIILDDSSAILNRVTISHGEVGLAMRRSYALVRRSLFLGNKIDVLADRSSLELIDTVARVIKAYLSNVRVYHYGVNPYELIIQADEVLREQDLVTKKEKFMVLLKKIIEAAKYVAEFYTLIKIIAKLLGYNLP